MKTKNYVIPVLLLLSSWFNSNAYSSQINETELKAFSTSKQWLRLLYYDKVGTEYKSFIKGEKFFLSKLGNISPLSELNKTIEYLLNSKKEKCLFPSRNLILHKKWPNIIKLEKCTDFEKWKIGLDAGDLYLIFSSAYPNNPASMFGHTFLRFNRKRKSQSSIAREYLGYSLAYQARTNPDDNAFMYTFKGILGGYNAYVNIMPYYMDIGVYNNSESRDLWEYPISLTLFQKELFVRHLWELSVSGAFDYYFFDENCSTFMARTLEAIKLNWNIKSKNDLFVVPQVVLKEIVSLSEDSNPKQRVSIQKKIYNKIDGFSDLQKRKFEGGLKSVENIEAVNDLEVLGTAIDFWKLKNYKSHLNLSNKQKKIMYATLSKRSMLPASNPKKMETQLKQAPHLAHDISRIGLNLLNDETQVSFRYGFHDFEDYTLGYDDKAYLSFLEPSFSRKNNKVYLNSLKFAEILSLQDFYYSLPQVSWRVSGQFSNLEHTEYYDISLGGGVSSIVGRLQSYMLIGVDSMFFENITFIEANVYIGSKYQASKALWVNFELNMDKLYHRFVTGKIKLSKQYGSYSYDFEVFKMNLESKVKLGFNNYF